MSSERTKAADSPPRREDEAVVPETVNSESPPANAKPIRFTKAGQPFREQRRGKIDELPDAVRSELDHRLATDSFRSYNVLSRWLEDEHSARVSPSALNYRKRHVLDLKLLPVKYATEEARAIVAASGGDNEQINRVLTTLVQTKLYEMLIQMNTVIEAFDQVEKANVQSTKVREGRAKNSRKGGNAADPVDDHETPRSQVPNKAALAAVAAMVRGTTVMGHHVREGEKWELDRDLKLSEQIELARQKVSKVATEAGLSPEVEKSIRAALMDIKL